MKSIDVFNGDADGICALHQLRLAEPKDNVLITGVKRDIALVQQVEASAGNHVTILDISLDKNRDALSRVLDTGASVNYIDHHFPGDIPEHENLTTHINTAAETCTGLIVNELLKNQYLPWAVTAAFGDNLLATAANAAKPLNLSDSQLEQLKKLGTLLNYNGYGSTLEDLYFPPAELYRRVQPHESPFTFIEEDDAFLTLANGFEDDHAKAVSITASDSTDNTAIFIFPNSVRAPLNNRTGADELCRQFETGGGRKAAAGINRLPSKSLELFAKAMSAQFG